MKILQLHGGPDVRGVGGWNSETSTGNQVENQSHGPK